MKYFIDDNTLTDIADAIREKTSSNDLIKTLDMPDAIRDIKGSDGGVEGVCVDEDSLIVFYDEKQEIYETTIDDSLDYWKGIQGACIDTDIRIIHYDEYEEEKEVRVITEICDMDCCCIDNTSIVVELEEEIEIIKDFAKITVSVQEG